MFEFKEEYPKVWSAMRAIREAVKEESTDKENFTALALGAVGGVVMELAMERNGNDSEVIHKEDSMAALAMIETVKDATVHSLIATARMEADDALN